MTVSTGDLDRSAIRPTISRVGADQHGIKRSHAANPRRRRHDGRISVTKAAYRS
jgi:hypothetical protein